MTGVYTLGTLCYYFGANSYKDQEANLETAPRISQVFGRRLKEIRGPRTQEALARRLMELNGISTDDAAQVEVFRVKVARTEAGKRSVSIDDAFEFAAALGVAPTALLYPTDELERVAVVPQIHLAPFLFEAWAQGPLPLRSEDAEIHSATRKRGVGDGRLAMWVLGWGEFQQRPQLNDEEREALRAWVAASRKKNEGNLQDLAERGEVEGARETREYLQGVEAELSEIEQALEEKEEK